MIPFSAHLLRCVLLGLFCYVSQCDCVHIKCTHSLKRAPLFARIPALLYLRSASNLPSCQRASHLLTATSFSRVYYFLIFVSQVFSSSSDKETDNSKTELSLKSEAHKNPDETDTDTKVSASLSPSFNNYLAVPRFSQETQHVVL